MASACGKLAGPDQVGGLFGLLEALESLAGIFGPTLGKKNLSYLIRNTCRPEVDTIFSKVEC